LGIELTVSLLAGLCTLLGAAFALLIGRPGNKTLAAFLGLAAGVMAGVVVWALIPAALTQGRGETVVLGFAAGVAVVALLDQQISRIFGPAQHGFLKTGILVALGIALHDLPEGMAVAAGFVSDTNRGLLMALTIGLHNLPEGIAIAVPLRAAEVSPARVILLNGLVSLITPVGTLAGLALARSGLLPISILSAAAAGAMSYIVILELLPRALQESVRFSTGGIITGLLIVIILSSLL